MHLSILIFATCNLLSSDAFVAYHSKSYDSFIYFALWGKRVSLIVAVACRHYKHNAFMLLLTPSSISLSYQMIEPTRSSNGMVRGSSRKLARPPKSQNKYLVSIRLIFRPIKVLSFRLQTAYTKVIPPVCLMLPHLLLEGPQRNCKYRLLRTRVLIQWDIALMSCKYFPGYICSLFYQKKTKQMQSSRQIAVCTKNQSSSGSPKDIGTKKRKNDDRPAPLGFNQPKCQFNLIINKLVYRVVAAVPPTTAFLKMVDVEVRRPVVKSKP